MELGKNCGCSSCANKECRELCKKLCKCEDCVDEKEGCPNYKEVKNNECLCDPS